MQQSSAGAQQAVPERPRLLCIDDESQVLQGLKLLLRRHYEVHTATDAARGLLAMEATPFGVVICDLRMPGLSGAEFMECMASRWPETVGIILSGARAFDSPERESVTAFRCLVKPCEPHILRQAVAEAFAQHETRVRKLRARGV